MDKKYGAAASKVMPFNTNTAELKQNSQPARMRSIKSCFEMLHKDDPDSEVTLNFIRSLAVSGKIPAVMAGRKYLINYDALLDFLANPSTANLSSNAGEERVKPLYTAAVQGIRRVNG